MTTQTMKINEWLKPYENSWDLLLDNDEVSADFLRSTGVNPCWPVYTASEVSKWGRHTHLEEGVAADRFIAVALEIAEALAAAYAPTEWHQHKGAIGRGTRVRQAIKALADANV